jgi:cysteine desulfurase
VKEAAALCKKYGTYLHVDAVQALGKMHIDFKEMDADYMSFSAHKIGGPQGVGCFIFGAGRPIRPLLSGGKQEKRQRAGTVNVAGIAGMGLAADLAVQNISVYKELSQWRDKIECELSNAINGMIINGQNAHRVGNTLSITCPGVANMVQLINLDLDSICVSAGSACSSGVAKPSHVLTAMGLSDNDALSTIRVSMGWNTSESDVNYFIEAYQKIIKRLSR